MLKSSCVSCCVIKWCLVIPTVNCVFIPHHRIVAGYYGITLAVHVSVCRIVAGYYGVTLAVHVSFCPSVRPYIRFRTITLVNINGFSPNSVFALILRRSGLGLLMGKLSQFMTELSAHDRSIFSILDDNFSNYQWIFTRPWCVH